MAIPSLLSLEKYRRRLTFVIGGGGVGGSFAAGVLVGLLPHPYFRTIDPAFRIVSSSVGSLIGGALLAGRFQNPADIRSELKQALSYVFTKVRPPWPLSSAPYDVQRIYDVAHSYVGDLIFGRMTSGPLSKPRLIPIAVDITGARPKLRKWGPAAKVATAITASCAAPTYFAPFDGCLDGALVSNTPAALAGLSTASDDYIVIQCASPASSMERLERFTPFSVAEMIGTMISTRDSLEVEYARDELDALVVSLPEGTTFNLDEASPDTVDRLFNLGLASATAAMTQSWLDSRTLSIRSRIRGAA